MHSICCICMERSTTVCRTFYKLPEVTPSLNRFESELVAKRRAAWLKLGEGNIDRCYGRVCVCSNHFVSGKPAYLYMITDVDWTPSLNLGKVEGNMQSSDHGEPLVDNNFDSRSVNETDQEEESQSGVVTSHQTPDIDDISFFSQQNDTFLSTSNQCDGLPEETSSSSLSYSANISSSEDCAFALAAVSKFCSNYGIPNPMEKTVIDLLSLLEEVQRPTPTTSERADSFIICESERFIEQIEKLKKEIGEFDEKLAASLLEQSELRDKVASLEKTLESKKLINRIRNNDKMTKFYTGLKSWALFEIIYDLILPGIVATSSTDKRSLPFDEQLLLVLMRLRLNLTEQDLAYRFNISVGTVSNYIAKWIDVMFVRLARNFMAWPSREANRRSMPNFFKKRFPNCIVIIDCFEVPIERFKHLLARCSTYSYYKGRTTVKFMIGITPRGAISFISQGYGGRSTDVHITLDKKHLAIVNDDSFLSKLQKDDEVLADRGFLVESELKKRGVKLTTPSFLGRRSRLTRKETAFSRRVSNVRIHVERVIGRLRENYKILTDRVPIQLLRSDDDNLSFFDKLVFVCCCLTNANPSVVPAA